MTGSKTKKTEMEINEKIRSGGWIFSHHMSHLYYMYQSVAILDQAVIFSRARSVDTVWVPAMPPKGATAKAKAAKENATRKGKCKPKTIAKTGAKAVIEPTTEAGLVDTTDAPELSVTKR